MNCPDRASQEHFTSSLRDIDREGCGYLSVVDDTGGRHPERRKSVRVRLVRRDSVRSDELEPVYPVGSPPLVDIGESLPLAFPDGDDELA
jgi:hypothetical protein